MPTTFYAIGLNFVIAFIFCITTSLNLFMAPVVMLMYRLSLTATIILSFCIGLFLDLLLLSPRFGFLGLSLALASLALYDIKNYFFQQRAVTIFLMTFLLTELCTQAQYLVSAVCSFQMTQGTILLDFFIMPCINSAVSWLLFYAVPLCFRFCKQALRARRRVS
jgi:hypothetical protein